MAFCRFWYVGFMLTAENPTGYAQRTRDLKFQVATYPGSGQIFGSFPIEAV
jgi:hypothetical protein